LREASWRRSRKRVECQHEGRRVRSMKMDPPTGEQESRWTPVEGVRMHARMSEGPASEGSPTVVLVHGLVVSGRYMLPTLRHLAPSCKVYAPDLPGFGRSEKPPGIHPDEPHEDMEWGKKHAPALLEANPELALHHMHDANQDRLMIRHMSYFRVKRLRLGGPYEHFLEETLAPGGTIFLVECRRRWPTTTVAERHVFQHGASGGATKEEYLYGGERVED
jgi:hypothetical protein